MPEAPRVVVGWDIGGAHVKAALLHDGRVADVAQWPCPLWQGLPHLERALDAAAARWPQATGAAHALTMTGEMADGFADREDGVRRIAAAVAARWPQLRCWGGDAGWLDAREAAGHWAAVASANWLATASHAAQGLARGVLVDIGSTTTDFIAFAGGRVATAARTDAQRLARGELVYHGVVRTPLCALAPRVGWRGDTLNVMNEFFATTADAYRLTGELDPAHDQQPTADGAAKDLAATRQRVARMIGLDARDGTAADWLSLAHGWRAAQVAVLADNLRRVVEAHGLGDDAVAVAAGCGAFLVPDVLAAAGGGVHRVLAYGSGVARLADPALAGWANVCAPCIAVAALHDREAR